MGNGAKPKFNLVTAARALAPPLRPAAGKRTATVAKHREEDMTNVLKVAVAGLLAAVWSQGAAQSAELIVYTGMGAANGTYEVAAGFEKASAHKVTVSSETGPSLKQKLDAKAPADLITGGVEGIQALIKDGHVVAGTSTPFGMAGLGVSVKAG